jgi:hypothetical protein
VIAAHGWWGAADPIEVAIVDALRWIGPLTAADLTCVFEDVVDAVALVYRLKRLVSEGIVEPIDPRRMRGVTVRRYRAAEEVR